MHVILKIDNPDMNVYCIVGKESLKAMQEKAMSNLRAVSGLRDKYTFYKTIYFILNTPDMYVICTVQNRPTLIEWATDTKDVSRESILELLQKVYQVDVKLSDIGTTSITETMDESYQVYKEDLKFRVNLNSFYEPLKEGSEVYTRVLMESIYNFNAPHSFKLIDVKNQDVIDQIHMQEGPVKECGVNGWANEDLINIVITRLEAFNNSPYSSPYNTNAIGHLRNAIASLNARTEKRKDEGKEGTSKI